MSVRLSRFMGALAQRMALRGVQIGFAIGSWICPRWTLARAYRLFCTPMASSRKRALAAERGEAEVHELEFRGERLVMYVWGEPAANDYVLLAHGWSSHALRFRHWAAALREAGYAVVAFDQVAHGRSAGRKATLPLFADALTFVGERFGPAAAVVGHSLGGAAVPHALRQGLVARRAILLAPLADPITAARRFADIVALAPHLAPRLFDHFEQVEHRRLVDYQIRDCAARMPVPALVVHDLDDPDVPWSEGETFARLWPQARMITTQGLGHNRVVDDPATIAAGLAFLRGETVGERVVSTPNLPFGLA